MFQNEHGQPTAKRVCDICFASISDKLDWHSCHGCGKELCKKHSKGMLIWKLSPHMPIQELLDYEIITFKIELCKNCQSDKTLRLTKLVMATKELIKIDEEYPKYYSIANVSENVRRHIDTLIELRGEDI
jgi:hypothetical protein